VHVYSFLKKAFVGYAGTPERIGQKGRTAASGNSEAVDEIASMFG
jgi:hypothetical protein